jgi:Flp pilus assembly pilin Flp
MPVKFLSYIKSQSGTTAIEYVLIASGIAIAILASVFAFGDDLEALVQWMIDALPV